MMCVSCIVFCDFYNIDIDTCVVCVVLLLLYDGCVVDRGLCRF